MRRSLQLLVVSFLLFSAGIAFAQSERGSVNTSLQKSLAAASRDATQVIWIYFQDKGDTKARREEGRNVLSARLWPDAAGDAALLLQVHPDWTVDRVRRAMRSTADGAAHPDRLMGWGIIDALEALTFTP